MKKFIDIKRVKFYLWVGLVYLLLWLFNDLVNYPETFFTRVANNIWRTAYVVVLNFILFEYLIPFISRKRKTIIYNILITLPIIFLYVMLFSWGLYVWRAIGIGMHIYTSFDLSNSAEEIATKQMSYSMMSVLFFGIIKHIYSYVKLKQTAQQLQIEKKEAELNYLKSQTNPHFLFNTLNNIYSLSRDKSDLAPESILRLSKILRFILYENSAQYIAIEQELKIISHYIELEKLRYDDSLRINFNYNVEDLKQSLPPLLLMPLVENAFKHGVSETRNHPFIDIHLSVSKQQLNFIVKNSIEQSPTELNIKENIGLSNLRRQLELLYKDFNLSVQPEKSEFIAVLKINLASHV